MTSQSSLPIQYSTGSRSDIPRGIEKKPDSLGATQEAAATSRTSFQTQLNENIINAYERSKDDVVVPDERTGVDRRRSANRRQSSLESVPLQSGKNITGSYLYSADQKIDQPYTVAEKTSPVIFSPSPKKGTLVDIWA